MNVGVPTEIKPDEYRVALTPAGVRELVDAGHAVIVQSGAGEGSAIPDTSYAAQGARIAPDAETVLAESSMILGVKEPQPSELELLEARHTLFTYLHLAADRALTEGLAASGKRSSMSRMEAKHVSARPANAVSSSRSRSMLRS